MVSIISFVNKNNQTNFDLYIVIVINEGALNGNF